MPQHDLDIANGSGAAVRADINGALAALGSTMKGPNAPPAPTAGMMWIEDDSPSATVWTLRIYDGADWIVAGTIDTTNNLFRPANAAPTPNGTPNALGGFFPYNIAGNTALVLPAGGTWAYFFNQRVFSNNTLNNCFAGVGAGGTTLVAANPTIDHLGFVWRVA